MVKKGDLNVGMVYFYRKVLNLSPVFQNKRKKETKHIPEQKNI
jgi:hypothetical protein